MAAQPAATSKLWLKVEFASAWSLRPTACDISVTVPTPSTCVNASTMNMTLPAAPTPASAASPKRATKYKSTRK